MIHFDCPIYIADGCCATSRVTSAKGSWKYQDAWRTAYYEAVRAKDGRLLWISIGRSGKYAIGPKIGCPITDAVYSLHRKEVLTITDDFGDLVAIGAK